MKQKDFDELVESVREAGRILRGETKPSREFTFSAQDVQAIRKKLRSFAQDRLGESEGSREGAWPPLKGTSPN